MTLQEFVANNQNKFVDVDRAFGSQCWDLIAAYNRDVLGIGAPYDPTTDGTILSSFTRFPAPLPQYFTKVINDLHNPNQVPPVGAIVFFNFNHAGIVVDATPGSFTLLEQNNPLGSNAHLITHPASAYLQVSGWLMPNGSVGGYSNAQPTRTATVICDSLNVRMGPGTQYGISSVLARGNTFEFTEVVQGQNVNGNPNWVHSKLGHYVWAGGLNF